MDCRSNRDRARCSQETLRLPLGATAPASPQRCDATNLDYFYCVVAVQGAPAVAQTDDISAVAHVHLQGARVSAVDLDGSLTSLRVYARGATPQQPETLLAELRAPARPRRRATAFSSSWMSLLIDDRRVISRWMDRLPAAKTLR